jgi:hypothetical protein
MKAHADDENEVHDLEGHVDPARCVVTPVSTLPPEAATALVGALQLIVRAGHADPASTAPDGDGIVRAQTFEEGDVYMIEAPYDAFGCDRYLMDFYNVENRGICSRMHFHTGLRFVRLHTGPGTVIRLSSLTELLVRPGVPGVPAPQLVTFADEIDGDDGQRRTRHNVVVPECSMVDMQVPRGCSHQFNAIGDLAVIDTIHPEEVVETFRENMSGLKMMAQTLFLAEEQPPADSCRRIA